MKHVILVAVLSAVAGLLLYPWLITVLDRRGAGQRVQVYAPATHAVKGGTPTMGGVVFCAITVAAWLVFDRTRSGFIPVLGLLGGGLLGALDDVANIRGRAVLGVTAYQKLAVQAVVGLAVGIGLAMVGATRQLVPGLGSPDLHAAGIVLVSIAGVIAVSNAVNLTDGVDGLAGSCAALVFAGMIAIAQHQHALSVAIVCAALVGAATAFVVFNWFPARIFMGDTGSLALGCALVPVAAELHALWLLPLTGIVFVAEALSVIINVTAIRRFHRRVFRSSPLHHHFEALGMRERRLVAWFSAVTAAGTALTVLYARSRGSIA